MNIINTCMHTYYPCYSIHRARNQNKGEWEVKPYKSLASYFNACWGTLGWLHLHVNMFAFRVSFYMYWRVNKGVSHIPINSPVYLRHWHLLLSWSLVNNTTATSTQRRTPLGWVQGIARTPTSLQLPLIHSFGRHNPSPLGTCLTEGKNRDEIAGCGSIPSILVSISAVIHLPLLLLLLFGQTLPRHTSVVKKSDVWQGGIVSTHF